MIRVFIGQDDVENIAYHVLANSIMRTASEPVSITPVSLRNLRGIYYREKDPRASNEFSISRFLVPYLCNYDGYAIFMDCDMLCRHDIADLWRLRDPKRIVQCVQHRYTPKHEYKYLGNKQYAYPRKNWSSMMLFNCSKATELTKEYVNKATPQELHRMNWAEGHIGDLSSKWNHLVGEYDPDPEARLVHYTIGGPWFQEYKGCEFSDEWYAELRHTTNVHQLPLGD